MAKKIATEVADGLKEAVAPFLKAQAGFMQMMAKETSLPRQRLSFGRVAGGGRRAGRLAQGGGGGWL